MNVLVACEFSGVVRDAFRRAGHEAWSCDLEDVEPEGKWRNYHLFGDCRWFIYDNPPMLWHLLIAHPPCTYLANSGVRWLYGGKGKVKDRARWRAMREAASFVRELREAPIACIAVENPIMHRYGRKLSGFIPTQIIQPWQFGHGEIKATCLDLKNLPPLVPTAIVSGREPRVHRAIPSPDRWKKRSRTLIGIAAAMAKQWGSKKR
jgi:hypothetical protein